MNDCGSCDLEQANDDAYILLFAQDAVLLTGKQERLRVPVLSDFSARSLSNMLIQQCGQWQGRSCCCILLDYKITLPDSCFVKLSRLSKYFTESQLQLIYGMYHKLIWRQDNQFCGVCGQAMVMGASDSTHILHCPSCHHSIYPRISPAVIIAVVKGDQLLLARPNIVPLLHYSVISGFVSPGETLEQCVRRELLEEVGIDVADITYFGSQPWPFPDVLMIAFTARYTGGAIALNDQELCDAAWFTADRLPELPPVGGIARQLIDWFIMQNSNSF